MNTKQLKAAALSAVMGVISPLAMMVPATSADLSWGGIGDGNHVSPFNEDRSDSVSSSANWMGGATLMDGDNAMFTVDGLVQNINFDAAYSLASIVFEGENTSTSSKDYTLSGASGVTLTDSVESKMTGSGGNHALNMDVSLDSDVTFMTDGASNTLSVGDDETTLDLAGNDLTLDASGGTITIQGEIDGAGNIAIKKGKVNFLATAGADYNPTITLEDGEFQTSDNTRGNVVIDGGTLMGTSQFLDDVTLNSGSIAPGNSPGCLGVNDLTLTGGTYTVEINGTTVCTEFDSTAVVGDIDLGSATTLDIQRLSSFEPEVDAEFAIITYEEDSTLTGNFLGLEDGEKVTLGSYTYEINYAGGEDSNAVTLTVTGTPSAPDTGVGSLISNPIVLMLSAGAVLTVAVSRRFAEARAARK